MTEDLTKHLPPTVRVTDLTTGIFIVSPRALVLNQVAAIMSSGHTVRIEDEEVAKLRPAMAGDPLPPWVGALVNRMAEVEHILREPMVQRKKEARAKVKGSFPEPPPLTPEKMWEMADKLSIPDEARSEPVNP